MPNTYELAKRYLPMLDLVYQTGTRSSVLDAPDALVRESLNVEEILLPKVVVDGLADYDRATGYVAGSMSFSWETHKITQERGRSFTIDAQDNMESLDLAFGATTGEFIRTKVNPEVDAYRFATLASYAPVDQVVPADLDKDTVLQAIDLAKQTLQDHEVDEDNIILFCTPLVKRLLKQNSLISRQMVVSIGSTAINREVDTLDGMPLLTVPQARFYTSIDLLDGTSEGEVGGGYIKTAGADDINFIMLDSKVALGIKKTALPRIFDPMTNQSANAWKFDYRLYHDLIVLDNKVNGIYVHTKAHVGS